MAANHKTAPAALGLDVGTSRICLARNAGGEFQYKTQLNAFVTIPFSKMTESVLKKSDIPHKINGSEIVVHGNESDRFADLLNIETRRTMNRGVLNSSEPDSLAMIRQIIASMLEPKPPLESKSPPESEPPGNKLCFTIPAAPLGAEDNLTYHEATLKQVITELGYQVRSINEGLAVVYAELEESNYTGIGISCGGGLCNACLAYLSVPVLSFSMAKAGDYIDQCAASMTGERANRIRILKEEDFHLNGFFTGKIHQVLGVYYDEMILSLVQAMKEAFHGARNKPKIGRPIPVVLSGGTALPAGFRDRFEKILKEQEFPIPISEIRMAKDPLHTSAKGALVAALADM
ncbi:MAG: hypothetical protein ACR2NN_10710 [Bryobacteraceae bacterium]